MKAVFVVFNQVHTERVETMLNQLGVRGYTWWNDVQGRGSVTGEPRMGTHTWPEMNSAVLAMVPDEEVEGLLRAITKVDEFNSDVGIRAFVWHIEDSV